MINKILCLLCFIITSNNSLAFPDEVHSDDYITSIGISAKIIKHIKYSTPKFRGFCIFVKWDYLPKYYTTPVVEQFLPDLVVSVYNVKNSNPFKEIKKIYENDLALSGYEKLRNKLSSTTLHTVIPSGDGLSSAQSSPVKGRNEQTRIVDVVGSPIDFISIPFFTHNPEPWPFISYYLSQLDEFVDRTSVSELIYAAQHPKLIISSAIGTELNHWGNEIPRSMRVNNPYRFRASVVAAMHGADIATNGNYTHVLPNRLSNSCGQNCVISNVIYDKKKENIIWQEVFPNERIISPGSSSDLGLDDDKKGKGNYVFVIWRKYKGCIQAPGRLKYTSHKVGEPIKR